MSDRRLQPQQFRSDRDPAFEAAAAVWDARTDHMAHQARNWRWAALTALVLAASTSLGWWYALSRSELVPIIVRMGTQGNVAEVSEHRFDAAAPNPREIRFFLGDWIKKVRSLPLDPVIARENWLSAYAFTTREAANKLNALAETQDPFEKLGEQTVSVTIQSIVQRSEASYEVRWREATFSPDGQTTREATYTGLLSIDLQPPTDLSALTANPLGLFITNFDWSLDHS